MNRREFLKSGAGAAIVPQGRDISDLLSSDVWIEISLDNIGWNLAQIRRKAGNRPVMAVIKANAYGHGVVDVGRYLERQSIAGLLVARIEEAAQLRQAGIRAPILHFGSLVEREDSNWLVENDVAQALYTREALTQLQGSGRRAGKLPKVHLVIDTGLGRLGVPYREAMRFIADVDDVEIAGTMMTFTEETEFDREQLRRFHAIIEDMKQRRLPAGIRHAASSDAILNLPESYLDTVRPGIMIYGHYPSEAARQKREIDLRPAATLKTRVAYVKQMQPGDAISYHRAYRVEREETIATLPIGYSDGARPPAAGKADVWINGRRCPVVAAITANHTIVRVPPGLKVSPGDAVEIMGPNIPAHELANHAGVSVYQLVIGMPAALRRKFA